MPLDFLTVEDIEVKEKKVLLRGDFNVPIDKNSGKISDDRRLKAALPTIKYLLDRNAKLIVCSHMGRPKGKYVPELSLKLVAERFRQLLDFEVQFIDDCIGEDVQRKVDNLKNGQMLVLENLRFNPGEKENNSDFAEKLSEFADIYVNDAFGTAHRAHASTVGVAEIFRDRGCAVAGFLLSREIEYLTRAVKNYQKPVVAIIGGAKIKGKIELIDNFSNFVDNLLIGGGMVYTFLKAQGYEIGRSLLDSESISTAKETLNKIAHQAKTNFILPQDSVMAYEIKSGVETEIHENNSIPENMIGVDIGPLSCEIFTKVIELSKTIIWNGPMGIFEIPEFSTGTRKVAEIIAKTTSKGALSVLGGGDTAAAVTLFNMEHSFSHISTGGGASLEFMAGKKLPAVESLNRR